MSARTARVFFTLTATPRVKNVPPLAEQTYYSLREEIFIMDGVFQVDW